MLMINTVCMSTVQWYRPTLVWVQHIASETTFGNPHIEYTTGPIANLWCGYRVQRFLTDTGFLPILDFGNQLALAHIVRGSTEVCIHGHFVQLIELLEGHHHEWACYAVNEEDVGELSQEQLILAEILEVLLVRLSDVRFAAVPNMWSPWIPLNLDEGHVGVVGLWVVHDAEDLAHAISLWALRPHVHIGTHLIPIAENVKFLKEFALLEKEVQLRPYLRLLRLQLSRLTSVAVLLGRRV